MTPDCANREIGVPGLAAELAVEGIGADGAAQFVKIRGRTNAGELGSGFAQAFFQIEIARGRLGCSSLLKLFQICDVAMPEGCVALLLYAQTLCVPVAREHGLAIEKLAEARIVEAHSIAGAMGHDVKQRLQRRAGRVHAAVLKIVQRDAPLRIHDGIHARGE